MTATRGRLYGAWHSTDTVIVADLDTGNTLPPLLLDGYNGWINGMAVLDGTLLVSAWPPTQLLRFDLVSGAQVPGPPLSVGTGALACVSRDAPP
jgi:hypothetical protein